MKTRLKWNNRSSRGSDSGSAVIVVITLLAILLIYVVGNVRTLDHLGREIRFLDRAQRRAWEHVELHRYLESGAAAQQPSTAKTNRHGISP